MTVLEMLELLRKKWRMLIILPLLFSVIAAIFSWGVLTNNYTASVLLYVLTTEDGSSSSVTSNDVQVSQQLANDIAVLARSNRVMGGTAKALGMQDLGEFNVEVGSSTANRVITLNITGKSAESVASVANELARQTGEAAVEVMDIRAVNVIDEAQVPDAPSGPDRIKYVFFAALFGLLLAVAWTVFTNLIDSSIESEEEVERLLGIPVLGSMPVVKRLG